MDINKRLSALIENDKKINTEQIKSILKSDFFYLISSYFEVSFDSINVDIQPNGLKYKICITCAGDNIKFISSIPE